MIAEVVDGLARRGRKNCASNFQHVLNKIEKKPSKRSPQAAFTTSTLQQEASRKLSFSVNRTMSVAQNAHMLNKKFKNLKLARSKTEIAFLLKEGVNCIWCPTDLYSFSKNEVFFNKEFALSMACHLTKGLLMKKIYLFQQDKLPDALTGDMQKNGVTVEYC